MKETENVIVTSVRTTTHRIELRPGNVLAILRGTYPIIPEGATLRFMVDAGLVVTWTTKEDPDQPRPLRAEGLLLEPTAYSIVDSALGALHRARLELNDAGLMSARSHVLDAIRGLERFGRAP